MDALYVQIYLIRLVYRFLNEYSFTISYLSYDTLRIIYCFARVK